MTSGLWCCNLLIELPRHGRKRDHDSWGTKYKSGLVYVLNLKPLDSNVRIRGHFNLLQRECEQLISFILRVMLKAQVLNRQVLCKSFVKIGSY